MLRLAKDQPYLVRQVRILLDGEDVTRDCDAFDVEGGFVRLYERNARGNKRTEHVCPDCEATRPRDWLTLPILCDCGAVMELQPARRLHRGRVEVVPLRGPVRRFLWRWRHALAFQWRTFWDVRELRRIAAVLRSGGDPVSLPLDMRTRVMRDPMSIYGPDPIRVQVANWNAGMRESQRDLRACVASIKAEIAAYKLHGGSCGAATSSGSVSGSEGTGTGLGGGFP